MKTIHEIEEAIKALSPRERIELYHNMPKLISRSSEDLDWQRAGLERFFEDDSPGDEIYNRA